MKASAIVVGPTDGPGLAVADVARGLGFQSVASYTGLAAADAQARQTPLLFFLFSAVDEVARLKTVAETIRFSPTRRIRFSPMVYFAETAALEHIRQCIEMGFDDVITMPFTHRRVSERIDRLIDRTQVFFETSAYFGPERKTLNERDLVTGQYRRLEIVRTLEHGVNVVRDEVCVAP
jgi:CheY-like chemotaxis protein